jgi:aspartate/methionine/tyrosine aminotransferase
LKVKYSLNFKGDHVEFLNIFDQNPKMVLPKKHSVVGNTIFSEMRALAQKHNAVYLSQGFPDYEIDARLKKILAEATDKNFNQYSPMSGNPILIEAVPNNHNNKFTKKIPFNI